jgi:hypothetical protein
MWSCVDCGERAGRAPDRCRACGRPGRESRAVEIWIPEPTDPPPSGGTPHSRVLPALPILVLIGALAVAAVLGGPRLLGHENKGLPASAGPASPVPSRAVPILESSPAGPVTVHPDVGDSRAGDVAAMFGAYFTGINERDYAAVAAVLDPDGELDPTAPRQLAAFARGTSTSRNTAVVLRDLRTTASGRLRAEVSFRSEQRAGHGPPERLGETCTVWRVVYVLTAENGAYRILRGEGTSRPC